MRRRRKLIFFWCMCVMALAFGPVATVQSAETVRKGLTLERTPQSPNNSAGGTVVLSCGVSKDRGDNLCNPYVGDTLCSRPMPLLCIIDINMPAPAYLSDAKNWSGGLVAVTDAVSGDQFSTIDEANAYCSQNFGTDWRVASFHDGGGWALRAYGSAGTSGGRVWVDIKTQSSGTCWSR